MPILFFSKQKAQKKKSPAFISKSLLAAIVPKSGDLAHPARFELTAYRLGGGRSILLSYGCMA